MGKEKSAWQWMIEPFRRYADFEGRARRAEYWWFALGYFAALLILGLLGGFLGIFLLVGAVVPSLAVNVRRLHDVDKSGWWILLGAVPLVGGIILLIWHCTQGTDGTNRYGPDPLDPAGDLAEVFD